MLQPILGTGELNISGVYEIDSNGDKVVPDGSSIVTNDDGVIPDFPVDSPATQSAAAVRRSASGSCCTGPFTPQSPPISVQTALGELAAGRRAGCDAWIIDDNLAQDRSSPASPGTIQYYGYCTTPIDVTLEQTNSALDISAPNDPASVAAVSGSHHCTPIAQRYTIFSLCASDVLNIQNLSGHGELNRITFSLVTPGGSRGNRPSITNQYPINDKAVIYPAVAVDAFQGTNEDGFVIFPYGSRFFRCFVSDGPPCSGKTRDQLAKNLNRVFPKPGSTYQAHHIDPISWGGDNVASNGVWLQLVDHQKFTTWWDRANFSLLKP